MNASPKEPNTNSNSPGAGIDQPATKERTSEPPASTTNKKSGNDLIPPIIPQRAVDVKSTIDTATSNASASPQQSGERMQGLQKNMAIMTADRASAYPQGGLGINAIAMTTSTALPQSEMHMREEILLLQEQQRLVEQEILQQRLLIAEQRQREGLELLALRGIGPSATTTTTGINLHLLRTPEALQLELLKVEAEESRLKQMQLLAQPQQRLAAQGGILPSILHLERELAMVEQAHAAEIMLRVRAEQAMQMRHSSMPTTHQPRASTATSSTMTPPNSNPTQATTTTKSKKTKRASSAATKTSTKEGTKKKRKVGRPIGSSAKAKQLADASRLFQTESFLLGMAELGPSDDFTMSPEMAASILGASKTTHAGLNAEVNGTAAQPPAFPVHVTRAGTAPAHSSCWADPIPNSTSRSTFILPCSRQPGAILQAPALESYRSRWSAIQSSLTNDTRLSPNSRHREALDQFLYDTRFAGVPIHNNAGIAGRYGVNSQGQVLQRMQFDGHIPHRIGAEAEHLQQQQQAHITAAVSKPSPPTQPPTAVSPKQQADPQNDQDQGKPKATAAPESKASDYLTSTPNMMTLPLQQRSSLPRMA